MTVGYIAATIPAKVIYTSGTTLFHIAAQQTNDALQWGAIAFLNGIFDPWINTPVGILIPPVFPTDNGGGIVGD